MLLNVYTLPQLAVSAKLLCLLMVVICGAVPSMVRSVKLFNKCSSGYVRVDMKGQVLADADISDQIQNFTIKSHDFDVKLTIYAEESKMYLCFNKMWRLRGYKKFKGERCFFYEDMVAGYNTYRSVANDVHYVGFNARGKPLGKAKLSNQNRAKENCFYFIKIDAKFSISDHNTKVSGGNHSSEQIRALIDGKPKLRHEKKNHRKQNKKNS